MKPKKKNKIFTFLCSLIPGAAEMYMGFMKMGLSLMAVFALSIVIPAIFYANDVLLFLMAVIWFFGFFHARNVAASDEEEFAVLEDKFIWEEFTEGKPIKIPGTTARKWIAVILIVIGCCTLWGNLSDMVLGLGLIPEYAWDEVYMLFHNTPQLVIAVLIILLGIRMIKGKKQAIEEEEEHGNRENN